MNSFIKSLIKSGIKSAILHPDNSSDPDWLNIGKVLVRRYVDLTNTDFSGQDLRDYNFCYADLSGSTFRNCTFGKTNFFQTDFYGADFSGSTFLDEVSFVESMCVASTFANLDLRKCYFQGVCLINVNMTRANLHGIDFERSYIEGSALNGCNLNGANFKDSQIYDVSFSGSSLIQANLHSASLDGSDFSFCDLTKANLMHSKDAFSNNGGGISRRDKFGRTCTRKYKAQAGAIFRAADLSKANISFADLNSSDFQKANFNSSIIVGACFRNSVRNEQLTTAYHVRCNGFKEEPDSTCTYDEFIRVAIAEGWGEEFINEVTDFDDLQFDLDWR
ncbi:pentapeptide repeat-containing protein [Prochlorothrix hollandica]|uniref:pentapeptide repeat-containing protein n=1 Tax=Prochlorothrix hollandica TaxID=1223 RepID=UPI00034A2189|nr:pentapeptide repeat-containing protein [Prochlorothrix hollandica]